MSPFSEWFREAAIAAGWTRVVDFEQALSEWAGFVDECERGYAFGREEYDNDLYIRDLLEIAFSPEGDGLSGVSEVRQRLETLDDRFKQALRTDLTVPGSGGRWWSAGVPVRAGEALAGDLADDYGFEIEVVKGD